MQVNDIPTVWEPPPIKYARNEKIEWTDWYYSETIKDEHPTYVAINNNDGGFYRSPSLRELRPVFKAKVIYQRKLIKTWTDEDTGEPWAEILDVETRTYND